MAMFSTWSNFYTELWKAIVRPPRDTYSLEDLGPTCFQLQGGRTYQRTDLVLNNARGQKLACSHFEPIAAERVARELPCVIYLHGNCSSRLEALATFESILPSNISLFCFDFSGSGLSDGTYLSLGHFERDDLETVITHLRASGGVSCIGLWGRSMGASTALLHADRDPSIAGLVLDSPFTDLKKLCEELVNKYTNSQVPSFLVRLLLEMVRSSISHNADFDIFEVSPKEHAPSGFAPTLFAAARNDTFVKPSHAQELHKLYGGQSEFLMIDGDHNSPRSRFFMDSVAIFFFNVLQCEKLTQMASKD